MHVHRYVHTYNMQMAECAVGRGWWPALRVSSPLQRAIEDVLWEMAVRAIVVTMPAPSLSLSRRAAATSCLALRPA